MKNIVKQKRIEPGGPVIWAGLFVVLILFMSAVNIRLLLEPIKKFSADEIDFKGFVGEVHDTYVSSLSGKYKFINVNGLYYRATGRRVLNGVIRLNNGMLTASFIQKLDVQSIGDNIIAFSDFLASEKVPFIYIQGPGDIDTDNILLPTGRVSYVNENANNLLALLEENGVITLDMRPYVSATPELTEQYFFKTDHHWNYTGAFVAFQHIMQTMQNIVNDMQLDLTYTNIEQWESHLLKDWFLGSRGKRVGQFFAGVDDIVYYTPKFETNMSCVVSYDDHSVLYKGDFVAANIREEYLEKRPELFTKNIYNMLTGGNYPIVQHRNSKAPNNLKVLIIKDSFAQPVQTYMSTLFTELDVIDPRYITDIGIAEYVELLQPDIVIMLISAESISTSSYADFSVAEAVYKKDNDVIKQVVWNKSEIKLSARNSNYNNIGVVSGLESDRTYILHFDNVEFLQGASDGVTVSLYDPITEKGYGSMTFDVTYDNKEQGYEWIFRTPTDCPETVQLLLYSGMHGSTANIEAIYNNLELLIY